MSKDVFHFLNELSKPKSIDKFKKKVSRFKNVDTRDPSWQMSLPDLMAEFGFRKVGSGKYASVFINKSYPYALKVFMKDAAYMRWISFAQKNQDNPYVPKLRGKVVKITPLFYAIRMEKLTPYKGSAESTRTFMKEYSKFRNDSSYRPEDPDLADVFEHFEANRRLLDLHGENMMMRGNQLVVIDPYYNWFGKKEPGKYMIDPNEVDTSVF